MVKFDIPKFMIVANSIFLPCVILSSCLLWQYLTNNNTSHPQTQCRCDHEYLNKSQTSIPLKCLNLLVQPPPTLSLTSRLQATTLIYGTHHTNYHSHTNETYLGGKKITLLTDTINLNNGLWSWQKFRRKKASVHLL